MVRGRWNKKFSLIETDGTGGSHDAAGDLLQGHPRTVEASQSKLSSSLLGLAPPPSGGGGVAAGVARLITKRRVIPSPRRPVPETFSQRRCRCQKTQKLSAASKKTKLTRLDEPGLTSIMNINETSGLISQTWDVAAVAPRLRLRRPIKRDATSENFLHLLSDLQRAHC